MLNRDVVSAVVLLALLTGCDIPSGAGKVVLPEPESRGALVMKENCSSCHAAPSPGLHTAEEWPNIIYRMQEHRRMTGYTLMVPEELEPLLEYLQRHSKDG